MKMITLCGSVSNDGDNGILSVSGAAHCTAAAAATVRIGRPSLGGITDSIRAVLHTWVIAQIVRTLFP